MPNGMGYRHVTQIASSDIFLGTFQSFAITRALMYTKLLHNAGENAFLQNLTRS